MLLESEGEIKRIFVRKKVSRVSSEAVRQKLYESSVTETSEDMKSLHSSPV